MNRRRRSSDRVNHERWLVSYADFITLLFAFFVVLFSSSQMDKRKVGKLSVAMQEAFQQMGIFQTSSRTLPLSSDLYHSEKMQGLAEDKPLRADNQLSSRGDELLMGQGPGDLGTVKREISTALAPEIARRDVVLSTNRDGLVISLREIGFFDSGSAEVRATSEQAIDRMAEVLAAQANNIRIEGHTDNLPIHNPVFSSNWELSTARATEMIRLFITRYHLPASRLAAAGYAEFHPVATNDTAEGRAQNRRVDIVVLAAPAENAASGVQISNSQAWSARSLATVPALPVTKDQLAGGGRQIGPH